MKNKMKKFNNSKGFSLVELIIAVALLVVVAITGAMFMSAGSSLWSRTQAREKLQHNTQVALAQFRDYCQSAVAIAIDNDVDFSGDETTTVEESSSEDASLSETTTETTEDETSEGESGEEEESETTTVPELEFVSSDAYKSKEIFIITKYYLNGKPTLYGFRFDKPEGEDSGTLYLQEYRMKAEGSGAEVLTYYENGEKIDLQPIVTGVVAFGAEPVSYSGQLTGIKLTLVLTYGGRFYKKEDVINIKTTPIYLSSSVGSLSKNLVEQYYKRNKSEFTTTAAATKAN